MESQTVKSLPFFFIGRSLTLERINNYLNHKHGLLSQSLGKMDTKRIWYSKEHIAKLLEEIEYVGGDGVRVSFGMYENSNEYAGQLCLLMNVTRDQTVGDTVSHVNVILENEPDYEDRSALQRDIILPSDEETPIDKDFNYGSPCPPRCDTGDDLP